MAKIQAVWALDVGQAALKALKLVPGEGPDQVVAEAFDYVEYPKILSQPDADPDQLVREALETTENLLLRLDADLAAKGIVPALVAADSRASGEDELRDADELEKVRSLRAELAEMEPEQAAQALADRIAETGNNAELLSRL